VNFASAEGSCQLVTGIFCEELSVCFVHRVMHVLAFGVVILHICTWDGLVCS